MAEHNFGPCEQCGCLTTKLFEVTNLATGAKDRRVCCLLHPGRHSRPATAEDIRVAKAAQSGEAP